jgi:DNA-binding PadR family transcriptional regulator
MYNASEDLTINKLILLYLLSEVKMPLSLSQITQIILERGYTNYFSFQQYLNELDNSNFITITRENNTSYYEITEKGLEALNFFSSRIPSAIITELKQYIESNWRKLKSELDIHAEYIPVKQTEYMVKCKVNENDSTLIELNICVGSKKQAIELCSNWTENASILYEQILDILTKSK